MLKKTQDEILEWSTRNFGRPVKLIADPEDVFMAAARVGKMAHALLKASQGIRGTIQEHQKDFIQAAEELEGIGADAAFMGLDTECPETNHDLSSFIGVIEEVGELAEALWNNNQKEVEDAVADIMVYLVDFCGRNNLDSEKLLTEVWAKVKQRDWKKNAATGEAAASESKLQ